MRSTTAHEDQFEPDPTASTFQRFEITLSKSVTVVSERTVYLRATSMADALNAAEGMSEFAGVWSPASSRTDIVGVCNRVLPDLERSAVHYVAMAAEAAAKAAA